jgi:hypothetical protein
LKRGVLAADNEGASVNSNTFAYVIKSATLAIKCWYPRFKNILDHSHTKDSDQKKRNPKQKISFNLTL